MRPRFKAQIKQCPAQSAIRKNISTVTFTRQISGKNREKKNCIENFPKIRSESNLNCNEGLPFHSTIAHRQFTHTAYAILFRCRSGCTGNPFLRMLYFFFRFTLKKYFMLKYTYIQNYSLQPCSQDYLSSFSHHLCCVCQFYT